jgi:hypothetical protein
MSSIHERDAFTGVEIEVKRVGQSPFAPVLDSQDVQRGQFQLPRVEWSAEELE